MAETLEQKVARLQVSIDAAEARAEAAERLLKEQRDAEAAANVALQAKADSLQELANNLQQEINDLLGILNPS